jgi:hypothetical protein
MDPSSSLLGELDYGFMIQTEMKVDVLQQLSLSIYQTFVSCFIHVSLQSIIDYFSYHNSLHVDVI